MCSLSPMLQSSKQASTSGATASKFSTADSVPAVSAVAFLTAYSNINAFNASEKARFVKILETNAYIKTNAITNVTIDKVIMGSINVAHTFAFTAADSTAAVAGQSSLAEVLKSGDAASIFGTSFGPVTVSNVTQQNTTNPTSEDLDGDFDIQDHFGPNPQADDMMRELEQEEVDGPWTEPRVRSARWFALRKDQAIYEGATLTVRQACFLFLDLKRKCRIRDVALDMLMRVLADVVLPQRNILPSSLYMVERVLQSRPPDSLCYHACPNDDFVWPQLKRSRWSDHTDDHCPECGSSRFQIETAAGTPCLLPMKEIWYFGADNMIRSLFSDPIWAAGRSQPEDEQPWQFVWWNHVPKHQC
ncbi:hypothetical protein WJX77_000156 [Trebouxia sp. C0004]